MPKLLLADDSPTTQKVVQLTFADEGIDVVIADDGDTAMEMFDRHQPDIVLADINIPGLNGYDICEAIRKRGANGKTPVVLLAGSFEPFDVAAANRVGANDYLTKPFSSIRRLVATVTALVDIAVKSDEDTHDTVEPDHDPPIPEQQSEASENLPTPGTKPPEMPEPDMLSTSDIENLYSQSVSDTAETSSQSVGSATAPPQTDSSEDGVQAAHDDSAFDDQLIETTYVESQSDEASDASLSNDPTGERPSEEIYPASVSSAQIPIPMDELPDEELPVPQSQIPTVSFNTPMEDHAFDGEKHSDGERGEYTPRSPSGNTIETISPISVGPLDQTNDEAYFEPAQEQAALLENSEQHAEQVTESASEELDTATQPARSQDGSQSSIGSEAQDLLSRPGTSQASESFSEPSIEHTQSESSPPSTPWDSYARPQERAFQLDESNLLEVPVDNGGNPVERLRTSETTPSAAYELTPDIVDQIAKLTATHISEEMIREIAKRVVPKVIEEVMTGRQDENPPVDHSKTTS